MRGKDAYFNGDLFSDVLVEGSKRIFQLTRIKLNGQDVMVQRDDVTGNEFSIVIVIGNAIVQVFERFLICAYILIYVSLTMES